MIASLRLANVPHALYEFFLNQAYFPDFVVWLQIRQVVSSVDIDGTGLESDGIAAVLLKPLLAPCLYDPAVADGCLSPQGMAVGYAAALEQGSLHGAVMRERKIRRLFAADARG